MSYLKVMKKKLFFQRLQLVNNYKISKRPFNSEMHYYIRRNALQS